MISKKKVAQLINERIEELDNNIFVVSLYISPSNSINVEIDKQLLEKSMQTWLSKVNQLIADCLAQSKIPPEVVMITGGMSLSPIVRDALCSGLLHGPPLLENDAFNSVCEGLAIQAAKLN